jgi:hypothetical protein
MYQNKLVASLKANGKILREFKDTVYIPFGSEYSFLLKNLHTQRALIHVYIDGENVVESGLVLNAGQEVDLERYVKNGNLSTGNKFKFIERTNSIEQHRGVKLEDGLVRIEFQFERYNTNDFLTTYPPYTTGITRGWITASGASYSSVSPQGLRDIQCSTNTTNVSNDIGITVPGSQSNQRFSTTTMGVMELEKHSIVLKLLGETPDNKPVLQPINVKMKSRCITCNKLNKANAKFCNECGTALEIFA